MKKNNINYKIIRNVPIDWYQQDSFFQRLWYKGKFETITSMINTVPKKMLDIGCASGHFLSKISDVFPKTEVYGIDVYDNAIQYGKKLYPQLKLKTANAEDLPFPNKSFDFIISTETIEHVHNPRKMMKEIHRVLKNNGKAIIEVDSGSWLFSLVIWIWFKTKGRIWSGSHLHSFNTKKLDYLLKECGFKIIEKRKFNLGMAMAYLIEKRN